LAALSTIVLPLPEEGVLLAAGYAVRIGRATLAGCIGVTLLAVLLGDVSGYLMGRMLLGPVLRTKLGQRVLPEEGRRWAERLVEDPGARAVIVARFLVGLRGLVYFAVGASRYPFVRFLAVDAAAGLVEVGALVTLGFAFGVLRARVGAAVDLAVAAVLLLMLFAPLLVRRRVF
jgi:membrane-associated protein